MEARLYPNENIRALLGQSKSLRKPDQSPKLGLLGNLLAVKIAAIGVLWFSSFIYNVWVALFNKRGAGIIVLILLLTKAASKQRGKTLCACSEALWMQAELLF